MFPVTSFCFLFQTTGEVFLDLRESPNQNFNCFYSDQLKNIKILNSFILSDRDISGCVTFHGLDGPPHMQ